MEANDPEAGVDGVGDVAPHVTWMGKSVPPLGLETKAEAEPDGPSPFTTCADALAM